MPPFIVSFIGAISIALFFNMPAKKVWLAGVLGVIAWGGSHYFSLLFDLENASVFFGALLLGISSEIMAIFFKTPSLVFSVSGSIPLVPGVATYEAARAAFEGDYAQAASNGINALIIAGSIAMGIMIATASFVTVRGIIKERKKKKLEVVENEIPENSIFKV